MKKTFLFIVFFLVFSFSLAQTISIDANLLKQLVDILQKIVQGAVQGTQLNQWQQSSLVVPSLTSTSLTENKIFSPEATQPQSAPLPRGVMSAVPESKPITPEVLKSILPDDNREDDYIVQLNNLRITRIVTNIPNSKAIFFAVRDSNWHCLLYESEESSSAMPCIVDLRKPIAWRELSIKITDDTILLLKNRQRAKLEDFQVGDKINVYGFMDKNNYGIEALIVRKLESLKPPKPPVSPEKPTLPPLKPILPPPPPAPPVSTPPPSLCIQVITPAKNLQTGECKLFPTPCDVPAGWQIVDKCDSDSMKKILEGYLEKQGMSFYMWGSHQLNGDDGKFYLVRAVNDEVQSLLDKYSNHHVKISGKVEYQNLEGGFWSILADQVEPDF